MKFRINYSNVRCVRDIYTRESFTFVIQGNLSKNNGTDQILSFYIKLNSYIKLYENWPEILQNVIPNFSEEDIFAIKKNFDGIIDEIKNLENVHLENIKKAILMLKE